MRNLTIGSGSRKPKTERDDPHSAHRQRQVRHLIECGLRCVLECLIAVERGESLDVALDGFCQFAPEGFHACLYFYGVMVDDAA